MNITIFGGSQPKEGDKAYQDAYELGCHLARANHTVITGGYIGTMEAVSRGTAQEGGHVIGITCDQIEEWRSIRPNKWVMEERRFHTLHERLQELILLGDIYMALPGGPGTLTEIALTWNMMIINAISSRTLILIGDAWKSSFVTYYKNMEHYISYKQRAMLLFAHDILSALSFIPK